MTTVLASSATAHAVAPVCANPDPALTTPAGTPLDGIVVCDGEPTSYTLTGASQPGAGEVTVEADNTLSFAPDPAFLGDFQFDVVATNADGSSGAPVQVTISVTNATPSCTAMTRRLRPLRTSTFALRCTDADGHALSYGLDTTGTDGTVTLNDDGTVTYKAPAVQLTDTFTVTASDDWAASEPVVITVLVAKIATTTSVRQGTRTCGETVRRACGYVMDILTVRANVRGRVAPAVPELYRRQVTLTIYRRTPTGRWKPLTSRRLRLGTAYRYRDTAVVGTPGLWRVTVRTPATTGTKASIDHTYFRVRAVRR